VFEIPRETVAKSWEGDYRPEHLFALRQSLVGFRFYQKVMAEVDHELELRMRELPRGSSAQANATENKAMYLSTRGRRTGF
jgi:hypothetical protein